VACIGSKGNAYRILAAKHEGKRLLLLGMSQHRWWDNIKSNLKNMLVVCGLGNLTQDRGGLWAVVNTNEP
jgi:hypothetical protein